MLTASVTGRWRQVNRCPGGLYQLPLPSPRNESTPLWLGHFYPSQKQPAQPGLPALAAAAPASPAPLGRLCRLQPPPHLPTRPPVHLFLPQLPALRSSSALRQPDFGLGLPCRPEAIPDSRSPAAEGGQASHWRRRPGSWHPRAATALGTAGPALPDTTETWAWGPRRPRLWGRTPCRSQDSSSTVHRACHPLLPERPPQLPTSQAESHTAGARQLRALTSSAQGRVGAKGVRDKKGQEVDLKFFLWLN